jgi:hypothetical protein
MWHYRTGQQFAGYVSDAYRDGGTAGVLNATVGRSVGGLRSTFNELNNDPEYRGKALFNTVVSMVAPQRAVAGIAGRSSVTVERIAVTSGRVDGAANSSATGATARNSTLIYQPTRELVRGLRDAGFNRLERRAYMEGVPVVSQGRLGRVIGECFVAGTLVHTSLGPVAIETVKVGDMVAAKSTYGDEVRLQPVLQTFESLEKAVVRVDVRIPDGSIESIVCTTEHPFHVDGRGWIGARSLAIDDRVQLLDGRRSTIVGVTALMETATVFNFEVADDHTYFVGTSGIWVHNSSSAKDALAEVLRAQGRRLEPQDFGARAIADDPRLHAMWEKSIVGLYYGKGKVGVKLREYLKTIESGKVPTAKQARSAFNSVRSKFVDQVNYAKKNGETFDGYEFDHVHHWNWFLRDNAYHALDPRQLFPVSNSMHDRIHAATTIGPHPTFNPIDPMHMMHLDFSYPLVPR